MTDTLGLVGDGDDLDLLAALEACFGVGITSSEAESLRTVEDIRALLRSRFSASSAKAGGCASAMAFYRLRKAFSELGAEVKLKPDTRLKAITTLSPKALFKRLGSRSGLRLRADSGALGHAGLYVLVTALLGLLPTLAIRPGFWFLPVMAAAFGVLLLVCDRGRLPPDCETLGDLAKEAAARNLGRLTIAGAQPREKDLWNALTRVLSDYSAIPRSEIRPETWILKKWRRPA